MAVQGRVWDFTLSPGRVPGRCSWRTESSQKPSASHFCVSPQPWLLIFSPPLPQCHAQSSSICHGPHTVSILIFPCGHRPAPESQCCPGPDPKRPPPQVLCLGPALGGGWGQQLTRPWGPVPSTADVQPPLLVQGTEGGPVIPAAAPVLWLQFLVCGERWHVGAGGEPADPSWKVR